MKIWSLQIARFWAALAVVHFHAATVVAYTTHKVSVIGIGASQFGRCGVDLFFVISGVIITITAKGLSAEAFIGKRLRRILPLYLLIGAPCLAVVAMTTGAGWRDVLASLALWPATDTITPPALQPAWTLCYEMLFYMAAAIVIWKPRAIWLLGGAYLGALLIQRGALLQFMGNPIVLEFLLGVGLAFAPRWKPAIALIPLGLAALLFVAPAAYHTFQPVDVIAGRDAWRRVIYLGLPAATVIFGAMQFTGREGVFSYLGDASYSLYLVHYPLLLALAPVLAKAQWLPADALILILTAACLLAGWRVYEAIERPLLRALRRPPAILQSA